MSLMADIIAELRAARRPVETPSLVALTGRRRGDVWNELIKLEAAGVAVKLPPPTCGQVRPARWKLREAS